MLYNRCTGIYKFGNNTYPWHIRRRSNLGHIFRGKKCVLWAGKYGRCTNFTNLFWHETLQVSDSSSVHRQEFIHCTLSNGICHTCLSMDGTAVPSWSCSRALYKPVWHIPLLSVQWINGWLWTVELSQTFRVSCQNKFLKLVHLVGFITKKFVMMHGHMNIKNSDTCWYSIFYSKWLLQLHPKVWHTLWGTQPQLRKLCNLQKYMPEKHLSN